MNEQSQVTKDWIYQRCQHLKFISKSPKELVDFFKSSWERRHIPELSYKNLKGMAEYISENCLDDKEHYHTKTTLIPVLKEKELELLKDDKDVRIRALIASKLPKSSKDFMNDRAITVFKSAARLTEPDNIFEFMKNTKSSRKKQAANEIIIERISQDKVRKFILGQGEDVIKSLME